MCVFTPPSLAKCRHGAPSTCNIHDESLAACNAWRHLFSNTRRKRKPTRRRPCLPGSHCACCLHDSPLSTVVIAQSKARVTILGSQRRRGRGFGTLTVSSDDRGATRGAKGPVSVRLKIDESST